MARCIRRICLSRYQIPLSGTKPFANQNHFREGLLVSIWDSDGFCGQGEVAPLAGFSDMDLSACQAWLVEHLSCWLNKPIPQYWDWLQQPSFYQWHSSPVPNSCRMGLEAAWLELVRQQPLSIGNKAIIPRCALITDLPEWLLAEKYKGARCFSNDWSIEGEDPIKAIKVKVGHESWQATRLQLLSLTKQISSAFVLCLDGNQAMALDDAVNLVDSLQVFYFEEPLTRNRQLSEFFQRSGVAYAWDETLQATIHTSSECTQSNDQWGASATTRPVFAEQASWHDEGLSTVVLKPALLGGLWQTRQWAELATKAGKSVVLSSAFESSLGISQLEWFATQLPGLAWAGLDTLQLMQAKLERTPRMWSCFDSPGALPAASQELIWTQ